MTGGALTIRQLPSTTSVSLVRAWRLSRDRAFAMFFSNRFCSFFASLAAALPLPLPSGVPLVPLQG